MRMAVLIFAWAGTCMLAWGQGSTAQIRGVIRDATGSVVVGAEVKVTQTATGAVRTTVTGQDGAYTLPSLPVGPYLFEVSKEGFSKYVQSGIVLEVDTNPEIDAELKIGSLGEQVTVEAGAALVETHSTGVGQVVDSKRVTELPLNGRNATELVFLAGMATTGNGQGLLNSVRNYPTISISVAGGQGNGVAYSLDGANHNDAYNNLNLPLPFPDALQEFKVETGALAAQYGTHASAAVNAVTKSGGNAFHGDIFEFLRNGDLNARDFFAGARDTLRRNQFGGVIGGPIRKDKLFFFAGYQGTVQRSDPSNAIAYVPTAAVLNGDFRAFASPACNAGVQKTLSGSLGFVDNQISPTRFNQSALAIQKKGLPVSTNPCGQIQYGLRSNSEDHSGIARIDYQLAAKHSMYGRLVESNLDQASTYDGSDALTLNISAGHWRVSSLAVGDTYLIAPAIVNSFRVGVNRVAAPKIADDFGTWKDFGIDANSFATKVIGISVTGGGGFAFGGGGDIYGIANTGPNMSYADDVSWVKGAHQFGFGGSYIRTMLQSRTGVNANGTMSFNGTVTGNGNANAGLGMADFLLGLASGWRQGNLALYDNRENDIGLYAQDSWKLNSRLTLSYGVRWEPFFPFTSKHGWLEHFDPSLFAQNVHSTVFPNAPAGMIFPGDPQWVSGNSVAQNRLNQFLPRVGVVWDPKGDGRMTIRAAFGRFTDRPHLLMGTSMAGAPPFGNLIALANVNMSTPWATYPGGTNPLPIPLDKNVTFPSFGSYTTYPVDWRPTAINQWNLSIQRQIGSDWLFTANYVGNNTSHLIVSGELNPAIYIPGTSTLANTNQRRLYYLLNPAQGQFYSSISRLDDGGTGTYNGLLLAAQKRLSRGVSLLVNYTWSHCISDLWNGYPGLGGTSEGVPDNRRYGRGNCAFSDQRQVLNLSAVAQTPNLSRRALRLLASGWQISPIMKIKSAQLFTVTSGSDDALTGLTGQRPNQILPDPYAPNQSVDQWLLPSTVAFARPAPGTYGNAAFNSLKGPGVFQFDMALSRTFVFKEAKALQFRAEAFNLPNHLNPSVPVSVTSSGAFGKIQSDISGTSGLTAGDPRIVQLALKLTF
jgi:carboxypeptidase family protein/TonB-dependent receptor-like protein